jgi:hypothetical protein
MKVRITKYDPKRRNEHGAFIGEDWTSVSDIGKFPGLTVEKYLKAEDGYWQTLASILDSLNIKEVRIKSVEFYDDQARGDSLTEESWQFCRDLSLKELSACGIKTVEKLFRAALREVIWFSAHIDSDHEFCAKCGYDFYMYVEAGTDFKWAEVPGIFVEEMASDTLA